jgi:hypothetical protein
MTFYAPETIERLKVELKEAGLSAYHTYGLTLDDALDVMREQRKLVEQGLTLPHPRITLRRARIKQEKVLERLMNLDLSREQDRVPFEGREKTEWFEGDKWFESEDDDEYWTNGHWLDD